MLKILVLSAGSLVGHNILEICQNRSDYIFLIGTNTIATEPSLFHFNRIYLTPETIQPAFEACILEIIQQEAPDIIIAGRDDDVVFLAGLAQKRPYLAPLILGKGLKAAKIMHDKWLSSQFCQQEQLPFIPSIVSNQTDELQRFAEEYGFPLLAKPRTGFASQGIYLPTDLKELIALTQLKGYMIQQYWGHLEAFRDAQQKKYGPRLFHSFEEPKISLQTLIDEHGSWENIFCTRHTMRFGLSFQIETIQDSNLLAIGERCCQAFSKIGWRGPLNIQGQVNTQGAFAIIEFNGRFTGATAARFHLNYDELELAITSLTKRKSVVKPQPKSSSKLIKKLSSYPVNENNIQELSQKGFWQLSQIDLNIGQSIFPNRDNGQ